MQKEENTLFINFLEYDHYIIFGSGNNGLYVLEQLVKVYRIQSEKIYFTDNDKNKENILCDGVAVLNPTIAIEMEGNNLFIISSQLYFEDIKLQLLNAGICKNNIFVPNDILEKSIINYRKKRFPREKLRISFDIVEHCNLNCKSCDHFAPLSDAYYMEYETFEKDLRRFVSLVGIEKISTITFEGGEPLLHPLISKFISKAREICSDCEINIISNGLLLEKMDDYFWDSLKDNSIDLFLTKYPIDIDYCEIEKKALIKGVRLDYYNDSKVVKESMHKPLDLEGKMDKYDSFMLCYLANGGCAELKNGKLYQCSMIANLHIFNNYYNYKLPVTNKDYVDIYTINDSQIILDYLCNPIPACSFCNVKKWTYDNCWGISERSISEWS